MPNFNDPQGTWIWMQNQFPGSAVPGSATTQLSRIAGDEQQRGRQAVPIIARICWRMSSKPNGLIR